MHVVFLQKLEVKLEHGLILVTTHPVVRLHEAVTQGFGSAHRVLSGVLEQPVKGSHLSTVHKMLSEQFLGVLEQPPFKGSQEAIVQLSMNGQTIGVFWQPNVSEQVSTVQLFLSSQSTGLNEHNPVVESQEADWHIVGEVHVLLIETQEEEIQDGIAHKFGP